jgi:hypothetical protein
LCFLVGFAFVVVGLHYLLGCLYPRLVNAHPWTTMVTQSMETTVTTSAWE